MLLAPALSMDAARADSSYAQQFHATLLKRSHPLRWLPAKSAPHIFAHIEQSPQFEVILLHNHIGLRLGSMFSHVYSTRAADIDSFLPYIGQRIGNDRIGIGLSFPVGRETIKDIFRYSYKLFRSIQRSNFPPYDLAGRDIDLLADEASTTWTVTTAPSTLSEKSYDLSAKGEVVASLNAAENALVNAEEGLTWPIVNRSDNRFTIPSTNCALYVMHVLGDHLDIGKEAFEAISHTAMVGR